MWLGLHTPAALHLVGHSLYKAHVFLSASNAVRQARLQAMHSATPPNAISLALAPVAATATVLLVMNLVGCARPPGGLPCWGWLGTGRPGCLRAAANAKTAAWHSLAGLVMVAGPHRSGSCHPPCAAGLAERSAHGLGWLALIGLLGLYLFLWRCCRGSPTCCGPGAGGAMRGSTSTRRTPGWPCTSGPPPGHPRPRDAVPHVTGPHVAQSRPLNRTAPGEHHDELLTDCPTEEPAAPAPTHAAQHPARTKTSIPPAHKHARPLHRLSPWTVPLQSTRTGRAHRHAGEPGGCAHGSAGGIQVFPGATGNCKRGRKDASAPRIPTRSAGCLRRKPAG